MQNNPMQRKGKGNVSGLSEVWQPHTPVACFTRSPPRFRSPCVRAAMAATAGIG
jgi:hypothetical protein